MPRSEGKAEEEDVACCCCLGLVGREGVGVLNRELTRELKAVLEWELLCELCVVCPRELSFELLLEL